VLHRYDLAIVTAELYVLAILKRLDHRNDLVLEVGDPQTYLLLYCSVFKERTWRADSQNAHLCDRALDAASKPTRL
jgi:hypothetical protein